MPLTEGHILISETLKGVCLRIDEIHRLLRVSACSDMDTVLNILCGQAYLYRMTNQGEAIIIPISEMSRARLRVVSCLAQTHH